MTNLDRPDLTLLYAPGDRPHLVDKAFATMADTVIIDLEDAVAPSGKEFARNGLAHLLERHRGRRVQVRVNALGTPWATFDLEAVASMPANVGVRIPKVTDPSEILYVAAAVGNRALHPLVESAAGVEAAYEVARAHPQVASLGLGEADLRSDLGVDDDAGLIFARSRVVNAARAAGLPAPSMSVYPNLVNEDGLARSCADGRKLGFMGRAAIHPRQLAVIVTAFAPSPAEVERAQRVVAAVRNALEAGSGTLVLPDGSFLDVAMVERARRTIALAERIEHR